MTFGPVVSAPFSDEMTATNWCNNQNASKPTCCNEYWNIQIQGTWLASFPERCFNKTDNRRYALIVKELVCMGCQAQQPWLTQKSIVIDQEPVYEKEDADCDDEQKLKETGRQCPRKRNVVVGGKGRYSIEITDNWNFYVSE